jgi:hypothetical protein
VNRVIAVAIAAAGLGIAGDFAILNLKVVEGEGSVYGLGSRATRGITVAVSDETGRPIPDATVSFRLPDEGPSGAFSTGSKTEVITTRQDGRASVWGMRWNRTPGTMQIRITAVKDGVRAGIMSTQYLSDSQPSAQQGGRMARPSHSRLLLISLAVSGAAAGGLAMGLSRGTAATSATTPVTALSIGRPSVIVGAP